MSLVHGLYNDIWNAIVSTAKQYTDERSHLPVAKIGSTATLLKTELRKWPFMYSLLLSDADAPTKKAMSVEEALSTAIAVDPARVIALAPTYRLARQRDVPVYTQLQSLLCVLLDSITEMARKGLDTVEPPQNDGAVRVAFLGEDLGTSRSLSAFQHNFYVVVATMDDALSLVHSGQLRSPAWDAAH